MLDFLIIGQGLAGTMLAWFLKKQGKTFLIIDSYNASSASQVSAGIIHPVSGRRLVKTWMADSLIPFAEKTYMEMEAFFSDRFFYQVPLLKLVDGAKEYNDWLAVSASPEMKEYVTVVGDQSLYDEFLIPGFKKILIRHSGWVDVKKMLNAFRNYFLQQNTILNEEFDLEKLQINNDCVAYNKVTAKKIIFCDGVAAMQNPIWKNLPFLPAKGEMLLIKCPLLKTKGGGTLNHIINHKIFILPVVDNLYKIGATYNWDDLSNVPTGHAKTYLVKELEKIIRVPFEVVGHEASVRPAVKDRRPFVGLHPKFPQAGIFNGLGAKGCLLAPFFANHFSEFLSGNNSELMNEIDVRLRLAV